MAGPFPAANFDLGPLSLMVNGIFNAANSVANAVANAVGVVSEPFDRYQGELISIEMGLGPASGAAMAGTMVLGRLSSAIKAERAINAELDALRTTSPKGDVYSVAFQTELRFTSYPGASRGSHFQESNENLLQMMEADASFARSMEGMGVKLERTPTGLAPRVPPENWT